MGGLTGISISPSSVSSSGRSSSIGLLVFRERLDRNAAAAAAATSPAHSRLLSSFRVSRAVRTMTRQKNINSIFVIELLDKADTNQDALTLTDLMCFFWNLPMPRYMLSIDLGYTAAYADFSS